MNKQSILFVNFLGGIVLIGLILQSFWAAFAFAIGFIFSLIVRDEIE